MTRSLCLVLILMALLGCGESSSATTIPTVGDSNIATLPSPPVSRNIPVRTLIVQNGSCGEIVLSGNPARPENENVLRGAGNCLAQAFQTCSAATLSIRDTTNNLTRQFSVVSNGGTCALRQALQTDPNSPPAVADCQRVRAYTTVLVVEGCSHLGDFILETTSK